MGNAHWASRPGRGGKRSGEDDGVREQEYSDDGVRHAHADPAPPRPAPLCSDRPHCARLLTAPLRPAAPQPDCKALCITARHHYRLIYSVIRRFEKGLIAEKERERERGGGEERGGCLRIPAPASTATSAMRQLTGEEGAGK